MSIKSILKSPLALLALMISNAAAIPSALASPFIVGVNVVDIQLMSPQQQDALVAELKSYGVHYVRVGLAPGATHFIIAAYHNGISSDAIVLIKTSGKHMRPANRSLGLKWGSAPLSDADPAAFKTYLVNIMAPLEAAGVPLAAFELGNEINNPQFNGDFLVPGTHRTLGLSDLNNPDDPEGQAVARGFKAYLSLLAVLKQVRAGLKVNASTPILSAGLADGGLPGYRPGSKVDCVGVKATIVFLQENGLDNLVDGYGVHIYPSNNTSTLVSERVAALNTDVFAVCTPGGKPCWLTEWGFNNSDLSCPIDDDKRMKLIGTMRDAFESFASQGQLAAMYYYSWSGHKGAGESAGAIFRCGALTPAGELALSPF